MTDLKNADGSPILDGAQAEVLSPDQDRKSTHGFAGDQNTLSFCRGANVEASSQPIASRNGLSDGTAVSGVAVSVTQVGHRALEGSNAAADFRKSGDTAKAALDKAADNGGPRAPMGQVPNGRNER